ncbi:MAG: sulfatase-like hydrolase/transferase [Fuerstiella sp.]|nr:sulfatase-like hydrolase/transferase [Fuerstiella sp.]MCP4855837.1 sulfatase-like hydrolase/transferase [Fuerstiella sp.]
MISRSPRQTFANLRLCVSLLLFFVCCLATASANVADKPNFVLILADDQGWNALSTRMDPDETGSGSTYYQTPNLDKLAAQGMRFSQAYAPAPTCSPTRHALQFGRSPASLKIFGADGIRDWDATNDESLANTLKKIDPHYVCAHLGKWHIGRSPEELGYNVSDGSTGNGTGNSDDPDDPKRIFDLSRRSNQFIRKQVEAHKPFFLQISHYANHLRYQAKPDTIRKYETEHADKVTPYQNSPLWAAMNEDLDAGIGLVLDQIDELGIADNTYVFYTADNGYELKRDLGKPIHERGFYKAFPQRSHKYTVSEGGIRVPFIVRGPGVPAGAHSPAPVVGIDIFATVMNIAGGTDQMPAPVEGANLTAHMISGGKEAIDRIDDFLVFKHSKPRAPHDITIVQRQYKLIKDISAGKVLLFDLKEDIGERNNLADEQPERTANMYAGMTAYFKRFGWDESKIETAAPRKRKPKPKGPAEPAPPKPSEGWIKPFNGEDLTGWGGAEGLWRVANGTIIGETTSKRPLEDHSYLIWRGDVEDFELRLRFRISRQRGNSGVQYRSRDLGNNNVAGYQYNIQATRPGATAVLEEMKNGRGGHLASIGQRVHLLDGDERTVVGTTGDADEINASLKRAWWNAVVIRAEGNHLQHWLNGHLAVDVFDDDCAKSAKKGLLAFQLHSGPPMKIELKDIFLRHLKQASKPAGKSP